MRPGEPRGPKDILGGIIQVGDVVAYAVRQGNTGELKVGEVLETKYVIEGLENGYWTWKVKAFVESFGYFGPNILTNARPSSPSFHKAVIVARRGEAVPQRFMSGMVD